MKFRAVSLAVATVALATPSFAADMPVKARAPAAAVCGNQFNGFYLGGNVGAVAYTATRTDIDGTFIDNSDFSANKIGATAGVQAGYDWQFCNKLFGVVADWNWSDTKANTQVISERECVRRHERYRCAAELVQHGAGPRRSRGRQRAVLRHRRLWP